MAPGGEAAKERRVKSGESGEGLKIGTGTTKTHTERALPNSTVEPVAERNHRAHNAKGMERKGDEEDRNAKTINGSTIHTGRSQNTQCSGCKVPPPTQNDGLEMHQDEENCPLFVTATTLFGLIILLTIGRLRDLMGKIFQPHKYRHLRVQNGYAPLTSDFESLYTRRLYYRIRDCWHRPITGVPSRTLKLLERYSDDYNHTFNYTGRAFEMLNLASYNYLGFAQSEGQVADDVIACLRRYSVGIASSRAEVGTLDLHRELEILVARFVGKEAAMIFNMGFATNALMVSAIAGPGTLLISDQKNHASLIFGCRLSGAETRVFKHNEAKSLEAVLREAIIEGQPRTRRPWKKIIVIVEGLYSMEGTVLRLPAILALKERYKFYLFIDEAHSIGALGEHGRGVCDYWGVNPDDVDILMGTFTKSFGAVGGYIAGSKELIRCFHTRGVGYIYPEPMPPAVCQQAISSMRIIMGEDGTNEGAERLRRIRENSIYFMRRLREMGFVVYGDEGSPIVPVMIFQPAKLSAFSHEALARGLAVVVVGYPATPMTAARVRFCISASHTRKDLDETLTQVSEIGDVLQMKLRKPSSDPVFCS